MGISLTNFQKNASQNESQKNRFERRPNTWDTIIARSNCDVNRNQHQAECRKILTGTPQSRRGMTTEQGSIMIQTAISGFALGFSLILAIGAQNAFVLRQGIRREHVLAVVLACAVSDALLIGFGVTSFGWLEARMPMLAPIMRYGGAAFLIVYGAIAFRSASRGSSSMEVEGDSAASLRKVVATVLALTWLNPHVYLDTVILVGSIAAQYGEERFIFGTGAMLSSFVFFFSLGYGARALAPIFARPRAWQGLDILVGLTMWAIAAGLILKG